MRRIVSIFAAVCLVLTAAVPVESQSSNQLMQGTQLRLVLLNGLSTSVARDGDPFVASVAEPVYLGSQLILPAGAIVHGQVGNIIKPRRLAWFRGQAAMQLIFRSIEVDHREIPVQMSILTIQDSVTKNDGRKRKDVKVDEGAVVEARRDIKGDVVTLGLGTGGGTVVGAIFSHVVRGTVIGLVGGTAYVMVKKGKEVELPTQTSILVRMDNTVTLPTTTASASPYPNSNPR